MPKSAHGLSWIGNGFHFHGLPRASMGFYCVHALSLCAPLYSIVLGCVGFNLLQRLPPFLAQMVDEF